MLNVVDRTPLGFVRWKHIETTSWVEMELNEWSQARGQQATGFALMLYASYLYRDGIITGSQGQVSGEDLVKSRQLKRFKKSIRNEKTYSFNTYDEDEETHKYVQFGRFDPFGAFFGLLLTIILSMTDLRRRNRRIRCNNTIIFIKWVERTTQLFRCRNKIKMLWVQVEHQ